MLNMETWVTPNHFNVSDFVEFKGLTPAQEFNLIAPLTVYFQADTKYVKAAKEAAKKLKKIQHPLLDNIEIKPLIAGSDIPAGLTNRYNALMMKIVHDEAPDAKSYIDEYGAFGFKLENDAHLLMGDAPGIFGFYLTTAAIQQRLAY